MSVKRYRYDFQSGLVADDKGGLVSYADYEKLVAENAGLKSKGRELLGESCAVYAKFNKLIDPAIGDFTMVRRFMNSSMCSTAKPRLPTLSLLKCGRMRVTKASTMPQVVSPLHSITVLSISRWLKSVTWCT
ncbi:Uncharacterised protein [Enterobacter hormaechei]|nr:Uncharacterised protein [Enterobacter hormaechei]CZY62105.1 Uncharacterised protein [Enterobacter hormaechei]CZY72337.1 Uncharacterised protein [Enterobacter hormaechei]SAF37437.1 Uncharacterised protein [Enterobacter hormaechei]